MVVAIIILSILLLSSLFIISCLWYAVGKLMNKYIDSSPNESIDFYFNEFAEKKLPCTLLLIEDNNANFNGPVYDFSYYEEKNIIGLISCKKGSVINNADDENEEDEPRFTLVPNQTVLQMKDGSYQWDFRWLM